MDKLHSGSPASEGIQYWCPPAAQAHQGCDVHIGAHRREDTGVDDGCGVGMTEEQHPTSPTLWIWAVFCPPGRQVKQNSLGTYHIIKANQHLHFFQKCIHDILFQNYRFSSVERMPSGCHYC